LLAAHDGLPQRECVMWRPDWREYCPAFPGLFIVMSPHTAASWKGFFTAGGLWRENVTMTAQRRAPARLSTRSLLPTFGTENPKAATDVGSSLATTTDRDPPRPLQAEGQTSDASHYERM
jgi:hypothetical protein